MKIRWRLQRQLYRLQKVAAPINMALLMLNLSLTAVGLLAWRGIHPYALISLVMLALVLFAVIAANAYTKIFKMHIAERRAILEHDPVQIYAFLPFQSVMMLENSVPLMRAIARISNDKELAQKADQLEKWALNGYIPRDEYPPALLRYYIEKGDRL